jgi:hypothetical protein
MVYIYVLKLQKGKYYIGKTSNPQFRLESHFFSNGSEWTKIYKPLQIIELIPNCDDYDEDKYTKMYMDKYGIDNVRGGSYTSVKLDSTTRNQLVKMSHSTNDRCFKCGKEGHFAKDCYMNDREDYDNDYDNVVWCCQYCDKEFEEEVKCMYHEKYCKHKSSNYTDADVCFRCGREGHYASTCYASKHIRGYYLN